MHRLLLPLPLLASLTACIIHADDGDGWWDDEADGRWSDVEDDRDDGTPDDADGDGRPDDGAVDPGTPADSGDDGRDSADTADSAVVPGPLTLDPARGEPGETLIVTVGSDGAPDLGLATEVLFFGDGGLDVLATKAQGATDLLVTVALAADGVPGPQDLLVRFSDGTGLWVEDAFEVVAPAP